MDKRAKQNLIITIAGVTLFAVLMNLSSLWGLLSKAIGLVLPVIVGGILALFLNVPVSSIERRLQRLFHKRKKQPSEQVLHNVSVFAAIIIVCLVIVLVVTLVFPEVVDSAKELYSMLKVRVPAWLEYLQNHNINAQWLEDFLAGIDFDKISQEFTSRMGDIFSTLFGTVSSVIGVLATAGIGIVIAVYMVLNKKNLCRHTKYITYAYIKKSWADNLSTFAQKFSQTFSKFLTSQCGEAVILGVLMAIAFAIFRIPYATMVGVLTAVCAIIPYIGAFFSCTISVFLTLVVEPTLALRCLIVYLVVQFVEGQFIYPRVVGGSIGMPPLYTLIAALIGGKLFGIIGMIFFIPLSAVVVDLIKADSKRRLTERDISLS